MKKFISLVGLIGMLGCAEKVYMKEYVRNAECDIKEWGYKQGYSDALSDWDKITRKDVEQEYFVVQQGFALRVHPLRVYTAVHQKVMVEQGRACIDEQGEQQIDDATSDDYELLGAEIEKMDFDGNGIIQNVELEKVVNEVPDVTKRCEK